MLWFTVIQVNVITVVTALLWYPLQITIKYLHYISILFCNRQQIYLAE